MNLDIPIKVEIRAQATSGFTRETVERRLCELAYRQAGGDDSVEKEIAYLQALRKRKWGA